MSLSIKAPLEAIGHSVRPEVRRWGQVTIGYTLDRVKKRWKVRYHTTIDRQGRPQRNDRADVVEQITTVIH